MSLILPFSDSGQHSSGGIWYPDTTNFPALKHFFPCTEASGGTTITDTIGGATIACSSGTIATTTTNAVRMGSSSNLTTAGTWFNPNTSPFVAFIVYQGVGAGVTTVRMGTAAGNRFNWNTTNPTVIDAGLGATATGTTYTLNTANTIYGRAMAIHAYNSATGQTTYECDTGSTITALASTATNGAPALTSFGQLSSGAAGASWATAQATYGVAIFQFTANPSAALIKSALAWMTYQWSNGNKWIYPGFKGVA